LAILPKE